MHINKGWRIKHMKERKKSTFEYFKKRKEQKYVDIVWCVC